MINKCKKWNNYCWSRKMIFCSNKRTTGNLKIKLCKINKVFYNNKLQKLLININLKRNRISKNWQSKVYRFRIC